MFGGERLELRPGVLIVGIGSPHGDDQIGWAVVRELAAMLPDAIATRTAHVPAELLDWLDGVRELVVCDACLSGSPVGALQRWPWPTDALNIYQRVGSHELTLPFVLALAERLGTLPERATVWGIEIGEAMHAGELSGGLRNAVPTIAHTIAADLTVRGPNWEPCFHA